MTHDLSTTQEKSIFNGGTMLSKIALPLRSPERQLDVIQRPIMNLGDAVLQPHEKQSASCSKPAPSNEGESYGFRKN